LLLTFRRAEAVAKLLKPACVPRICSLTPKISEAADAAKPPAPGALPAHLSGRRVRKAGDIALLQYTSGSTGDPKGVTLTHTNLLANIRAIGEALQMSSEDVGISWLPLYHDMGLIGAWLALLHFGTPLCVMSPLAFLTRPERWLQAFHKHRGTITAAPNFAYELCVRKIADKDIEGIDPVPGAQHSTAPSSIRKRLLVSNSASPNTVSAVRRNSRFYGLAEASLAVTFPPLNRGPRVDVVHRETFTAQGRAVPRRTIPLRSHLFLPVSPSQIMKCASSTIPATNFPIARRFFVVSRPSATSGYQQYRRHTNTIPRRLLQRQRICLGQHRRPRLSRRL
jgi:acyl-CoA synthetase (AMP-forming)/AMP-acid ligase II